MDNKERPKCNDAKVSVRNLIKDFRAAMSKNFSIIPFNAMEDLRKVIERNKKI